MPHLGTVRRHPLALAAVVLGSVGALAAVASGGCSSGAETVGNAVPSASVSSTASTPIPPGSELPPTAVCGDQVCDHVADEDCSSCSLDCGECPVCGNGTCEKERGLETCDSCPDDCGACSECGDGTCSAEAKETCTSCMKDCGECASCGDGTCDEDETCESCAKDCGACQTCGDGTCDTQAGETCTTCDADCGACTTCGNGKCEGGKGETCSTCKADCGACVTVKCGDGTCNGNEDCASCAKDCGQCPRKGCVQGDFEPYWGNLHAHTHLSDGKGTPGEAFHHARNVTKPALDFMWLSDHRGVLTPAEWKACLAAANKATKDGEFAAGCGFENTIPEKPGQKPGIGHFNVLFPSKFFKEPTGLLELYQVLDTCDTCLGQFNHPGFPGPPGKTFHSYQFFPVARDKVRLIEFNGHGGDFDLKMDSYFLALEKGWMISPSYNEDNHNKGWGDSSNATLVWAEKLTRPEIRAAVKAHRTAATSDDTASIKVLADGKCWMGSELHGLGSTTLTVTLADKSPKDGFTTVRVLGPDRKVLASFDCDGKNDCQKKFTLQATKATPYMVVVARQKDGDFLVSAPIWYEP